MHRGSILAIGGPPKTFKSILVNSMLCHIAMAEPLFNISRAVRDDERQMVFPVDKPHKILYIEQEVGEEDLQDRFNKYMGTLSKQAQLWCEERIHIESCNHAIRLDTNDGMDNLKQLISEAMPDVLCLDPFREFHGLDENSSNDMSRVFRPLDELREMLGFSVILVHHTGKPNGESHKQGLDLFRGSSAIAAKIDSAMLVSEINKKGLLKVAFWLRRGKRVEDCQLQIDVDKTLRVDFAGWGTGKPRTAKLIEMKAK